MKVLGSHTWKSEVVVWKEPMLFDAWREAVCQGRDFDELMLREFHGACWDAADCREYLLVGKAFNPPKSRNVTLDLAAVNKRIAKAIWVECNKLRVRRCTLEARNFVFETLANAEKAAGIESFETGE